MTQLNDKTQLTFWGIGTSIYFSIETQLISSRKWKRIGRNCHLINCVFYIYIVNSTRYPQLCTNCYTIYIQLLYNIIQGEHKGGVIQHLYNITNCYTIVIQYTLHSTQFNSMIIIAGVWSTQKVP